ncbi:MAG: DapH/DapD/GlmU-related protein, partial [Pseudomonadota bacterium]|nr:DapH/DapD/GlmU-related protein [Pseudomonadota bacterium]
DVWIGGGAIVLAGVSIGDRAVVGAGSVVTRDVPADVVVVGNPAKIVRRLTPA